MKISAFGFSALFNKKNSTEVDILIFVDHIVAWFEDKKRLEELQKDMNVVAISIKEKKENGKYQVINCLFNKAEGKIVRWEKEEDIAIIVAKELDAQTIEAFKDKDMIILE